MKPTKGKEKNMTRYFATHKAVKGILTSGYEAEAEAKERAEWLANTYGGVAKVSANFLGAKVSKYSTSRGWH